MTAQTVDTSKLWDVIKDIRFGMLTVRGADGRLYARPMTTRNGEADRGGVIWFFMSRSGQPMADLTVSPDVNVAYADPGSDMYVSVSGAAPAQAWFPGVVEDPNLALVAVLVAEAEYWDVRANKAVQILKLARAVLTPARSQPTWRIIAASACADGVGAVGASAARGRRRAHAGTYGAAHQGPWQQPDRCEGANQGTGTCTDAAARHSPLAPGVATGGES